MVFSKDDLAVIVACFIEKGWTGTRIAKEFPNKKWNYRSINRVLAKYRQTGSIDLKKGRGRPVTAMTNENLDFTRMLTRMDTAFARFESARLLSLRYLARTCL